MVAEVDPELAELYSFVIDTGQSGGLEQAMKPVRATLLAVLGLVLALSMVVASSQPEPTRPTDSTERRVGVLIGQLDHGTFAQREQATKELKKLGRSIVPQLEAALDQARSLEVQRRLQQVLDWYRIRPEWHTGRAEFVKRLGNRVREVNFADLDTSAAQTVSFLADRYAKKQGVIISGDGGQYASRNFGFPDQYPAVRAEPFRTGSHGSPECRWWRGRIPHRRDFYRGRPAGRCGWVCRGLHRRGPPGYRPQQPAGV
jgi:hypothetical protein